MQHWKKLILATALLTLPAQAVPVASITKVEGATVTLNRGKDEQVQQGTRLFIVRNGKTLAEVQVDQVTPLSSRAKIVRIFSGETIIAGDIVNSEQIGAVVSSPPSGGPVGGPPSSGSTAAAGTPPARPAAYRPLPIDLTLSDAEQAYRDKFESRTQRKNFRQVVTNARSFEDLMPGSQFTNIYMTADLLATSFGPGGFYGDPSFLLMNAWMAYESQRSRAKLFDAQDVQLEVEVTYWDPSLLESYGQYAALVNGFSEPTKYQGFMANLASQKGVNGGRVFEVRLRNKGQVKAQLAPFNWHIFMVGPNGSRVGASRYDQTLDRLIDPQREVTGNVYFPVVPSSGSKMEIIFEDMYGDRGDLQFSLDGQ